MTIEDLKAALDEIPADNAMDLARRREIQRQILELKRQEKEQE